MPVDDGAGYGPATARKQRDFAYIVATHLRVVEAITEKGKAPGCGAGGVISSLPPAYRATVDRTLTGRSPRDVSQDSR
jgi:hypothetical protein